MWDVPPVVCLLFPPGRLPVGVIGMILYMPSSHLEGLFSHIIYILLFNALIDMYMYTQHETGRIWQ